MSAISKLFNSNLKFRLKFLLFSFIKSAMGLIVGGIQIMFPSYKDQFCMCINLNLDKPLNCMLQLFGTFVHNLLTHHICLHLILRDQVPIDAHVLTPSYQLVMEKYTTELSCLTSACHEKDTSFQFCTKEIGQNAGQVLFRVLQFIRSTSECDIEL